MQTLCHPTPSIFHPERRLAESADTVWDTASVVVVVVHRTRHIRACLHKIGSRCKDLARTQDDTFQDFDHPKHQPAVQH